MSEEKQILIMLAISLIELLILIIGIPLAIFLFYIKAYTIALFMTGFIILVLFRYFTTLLIKVIAYIFEDFPKFVKVIGRTLICISIVIQVIIIVTTIIIVSHSIQGG